MHPWLSLVRLPLLLAPAVLSACGDDAGPRTPAAIVITPNLPRVPMGQTLQLTATVVDDDGRAIDGEPVSFESSEPSILTVSESGLLTSVGSVGASVIRAASGDVTEEVDAEAVLGPSALFVSPASLDLESDEFVQLNVTVTDEHGDSIPDAEILFLTSDALVADVSPDGYVSGGEPGTATLTVTSGTYRREVPVTVSQAAHSMTVTPATLVLAPGASEQLIAHVLDLGGDPIPGIPIAFSSSDEAVLTVDPTGHIQSMGPDGLVTITATSGSLEATALIYVGTPPTGEVLASVPLDEAWNVVMASAERYLAVTQGSQLLSGTLPDFGFPVSIPIDGSAVDVAVNAAGTRAYVLHQSNDGDGVAVVDLTTDQVIDDIPLDFGTPFRVALSPDESRLIVGTHLGVVLLDIAGETPVSFHSIGQVQRLVRDPARPLVYAPTVGGEVVEVAVEGEVSTRTLPIAGVIEDLAIAPDGTRLYALERSESVIHVWNLETGSAEPSLPSPSGTALIMSSDGRFLWVLNFERITVLEPGAGLVLRTMELGTWSREVAFAGDLAIIADNSGNADPDAVHFVR